MRRSSCRSKGATRAARLYTTITGECNSRAMQKLRKSVDLFGGAEIWTYSQLLERPSAGEFSRLQGRLIVTGDIIKESERRRGGQNQGPSMLFTLAVAGET